MLLLFYFVGRSCFFQTFVTYSFIIELHVRDHARQHLPDIFAAAQDQDGGAGGT